MSPTPNPVAYKTPETNGGIVTSWTPVTTAFAAPTDCSSLILSQYDLFAAWDPGYGVSVENRYTCHPKAVTTWWLADKLGQNPNTVVSLGPITCPSPYTTAASSVKDACSTMIYCCPTDYDFVAFAEPGRTGECVLQFAAGHDATFAINDAGWTTNTSSIQTKATCRCRERKAVKSGVAAGVGVGVSLGVTGLAMLIAGIFMLLKARRIGKQYLIEKPLQDDAAPTEGGYPFFAASPGEDAAASSSYGYSNYTDGTQANTNHTGESQLNTNYAYSAYTRGPQVVPVHRPVGELDSDPRGRVGPHSELEGEFDHNTKVAFPSVTERPSSRLA